VLHDRGENTAVGDEGGFAPNLASNEDAIKVIMEAIAAAGYKADKEQFGICMDAASSELFEEGGKKGYKFWKSDPNGKLWGADEMIKLYEDWVNKYPIISLEDPLDQDDWDGYVNITKALGSKVQIVGDDFFVTNTKRLSKGIQMGACNSILIKVNQIGTLTETIEAINMAKQHGYTADVSHRSGETEDTVIADLVVGLETGQIKTGSMSRTDRVCKYNQLMRIEDELEGVSQYAGHDAFYNIKK
jgi:enolase